LVLRMNQMNNEGFPIRRVRIFLYTAAGLMLCAGGLFRYVGGELHLAMADQVKLPVPLKEFPLELGNWKGREEPIPELIQKVANNDDYVSNLYQNSATNEWVSLYVAYSGHPRTMLGHRPQVCYPGQGWIPESLEPVEIATESGRQIECLLHQFYKTQPYRHDVFVLNFYILNGRTTTDEGMFSGLRFRRPNLAGDPTRYVAQVQISSTLEHAVKQAAIDFSDMILRYLPDETGFVRAEETREQPDGLKESKPEKQN